MSDKKTPKFLKPGKVVVLLNGRQAGKKAVIVKTFDDGTADRPYGHCMVAGIQKYPLKITKSMSEKKITKRSKVKPFAKSVNYNHIMPTRYALDIDTKAFAAAVDLGPGKKEQGLKDIKKMFEDKFNTSMKTGKNKWFFQKLRF